MWEVNGRGLVVLEEVTFGVSLNMGGVSCKKISRRRERRGQVTVRDGREKDKRILYVAWYKM